MAVTFVKGASTLTFPSGQNREYPLSDKEFHKGKVLRTKADVPCFDPRYASNPKEINLSLRGVTQDFYDSLKNWFDNVSEGKLYKFNYTNDVGGETSLSVRWTNGFDFIYDGRYYSGLIKIEKEL